jgi:hypothetical protein
MPKSYKHSTEKERKWQNNSFCVFTPKIFNKILANTMMHENISITQQREIH